MRSCSVTSLVSLRPYLVITPANVSPLLRRPLPSAAAQVRETQAAARKVLSDAAPVAHLDPTHFRRIAGLNLGP